MKGGGRSVFVLFLSSITEIEARLPSPQLMALCRNEVVLKWMSTCDHLMYQALVEILIPDVLRPIPSKQQSRTRQLYCALCTRAGSGSVLALWAAVADGFVVFPRFQVP